METPNVSSQPNTLNGTTPQGANSSVLSSDFETFLKMLTAQAQYQDPLEPIDSTQYASQLAQFSAVEQQVLGNDLLTNLVDQLGTGDMARLAGWVGMSARSAAPVEFNGSPLPLSPEPAANADQAFLVVRNTTGNEIQRIELSVSNQPVEWAGVAENGAPVTPGNYSFEVESFADGELILSAPVETYSRVVEARLTTGGGTELILEGGEAISPEQVTGLRLAEWGQ